MPAETVTGYSFSPDDLDISRRTPGISLFMRIRNGAEFLEAAIMSHAEAVDEIVAVHNQCDDGTDAVLERLQGRLAGKLRVFRYADRVHPPGSEGHALTAPDAPASFVNMSNFALSRTRHTIAMKLDDDHLAIGRRFADLAAQVRARGCRLEETLCFGGINLARDAAGRIGIPAHEPLVGAGDHFLFEVRPETYFLHDRRFEDFNHGRRRVFADITYWHLKYLKEGLGFANYELEDAANARFQRKKERLLANRDLLSLGELAARRPYLSRLASILPAPEKQRLKARRWQSVTALAAEACDFRDDLRRFGIADDRAA